MSKCQRCQSERVASVDAKCDDRCSVSFGPQGGTSGDYVPRGMGIGSGDYVAFSWCLDCGQMQGKFPLPPSAMEENDDDFIDDDEDEEDDGDWDPHGD